MSDYREKTWDEETTTNSYADLGNRWSLPQASRITLVVHNTGGANGAMMKVLGTVDGTNWDFAWAVDQVLAAGATGAVTISDTALAHVKIQIKAQVAESQTTVKARGHALIA